MKYTEEENNFLIENYGKYGARYCSNKLHRNVDAIIAKASRLGLKIKDREIHPEQQKVSVDNFLNINKPEVAYFLGYFWADGYIRNYRSNNITHWRIVIEIVNDDAEDIMSTFMSLGKWSLQKRKRTDTYKETCSFVTNNKSLYLFLTEHEFLDKSTVEPTKILSKIPDELKVYFWRGFFDGDGSAGLSGRGSYIELSSTFNYEYLEVQNLFNTFEVTNSHIYRTISKRGHKSSVIKVYGKPNVILSKYFLTSEIGLKRKSEKLKQIISKYEK